MGRMTPDHDDSNAAQMCEHKEIVEHSITDEATAWSQKDYL